MPWYSCRRCGEVERFNDDRAAAAKRCGRCGSADGWERLDEAPREDGASTSLTPAQRAARKATLDRMDIDPRIRAVVESAPPLTPEQAERLRQLLGFGMVGTEHDGEPDE